MPLAPGFCGHSWFWEGSCLAESRAGQPEEALWVGSGQVGAPAGALSPGRVGYLVLISVQPCISGWKLSC